MQSKRPGIYEVLFGSEIEFWNYRRSKVNITCDSDVGLNIYMLPMCVSYGCEQIGAHFDVSSNRKALDSNLVIAYYDRKDGSSLAVYSNAVLTCNETTVRAREVVINKKTGKIVAEEGWIEKGLSRKLFEEQEIEIPGFLKDSHSNPTRISDRENVCQLRKIHKEIRWPNP